MKRLFALQAAIAVILLFFVAVYGARVFERHHGARLRLGGPRHVELAPTTLSYLESLRGRLTLTYFVSARARMPSSMKGVEDGVRGLLERIKAAAPEKIDLRVLDPDLDPERDKASYASGKSASPIKVRRILADESSEEAVWSSLHLSHDAFPDALIQDIRPGDLPHLEDLIVANLRAAETPIQATIAIASPSRGFARVRELIREYSGDANRGVPAARIVEVDLDREARLPAEADWLIWIAPRHATHEHAVELARFVRSGRSAIVAGSAQTIDYLRQADGTVKYRATPSATDWKALLQPFGLAFTRALVLDKNHEAIAWTAADGSPLKVDAPFHLRILPSLFNTKSFLGPNAGALLVSAISPIASDPRVLAASGLKAEVVATTSEHARAQELPEGDFDDAALEGAPAVPKQPWLVLVRSGDPWQGEVLVASSATLFHDAPYAQGGNANQVFFRTLLRTYTHSARLARIRVSRVEPPRLPSLSLVSRVIWRGATVFLVPAVLLLLALRVARSRRRGPVRLPWVKPAIGGTLGLASLLLVLHLASAAWLPRLDVTEDRINTPSPLTSRLLDGVRDGLQAELILSDSMHLPASLKGLERRIVDVLGGLGIRPALVRPEDLSKDEQAKLRAARIEPFDVEGVENDAPVTARVWGALRLLRGDRVEVIPQLDARAAEHLEFLVASAAKRLQGTRAARVGVLSDLPRLSPAEAHTDYQEKGYTAPVGSDVYSDVKKLLAQRGYDVVYINPDTPVFPPQMDTLVWLQPRYPWKAWAPFTKYMHEGGRALVAVQHYNVQQRQYRGTGFKTVYWPQPQFHNFNDFLKLIGVRQIGDKVAEQPGEILLDRSHASLVLDTQVNRSAFREHDAQQVARPFLIRAAGDSLSAASVITRRLGSLLLIWPSRFSFDEPRLRELQLTPQVLVTTSPRCWSYAWSGGWIPDESYIEPAVPTLGVQPLAVLLEGRFPAMELKKEEGARESLVLAAAAGPTAAPGKLLLVGSSELLKDQHLFEPGFQHDQLLLNAVAYLAHGEELAAVQARRRVPKSLPFQPQEAKVRWRLIALGLAPAVFLAAGLCWWWWRRRPLLGTP